MLPYADMHVWHILDCVKKESHHAHKQLGRRMKIGQSTSAGIGMKSLRSSSRLLNFYSYQYTGLRLGNRAKSGSFLGKDADKCEAHTYRTPVLFDAVPGKYPRTKQHVVREKLGTPADPLLCRPTNVATVRNASTNV